MLLRAMPPSAQQSAGARPTATNSNEQPREEAAAQSFIHSLSPAPGTFGPAQQAAGTARTPPRPGKEKKNGFLHTHHAHP